MPEFSHTASRQPQTTLHFGHWRRLRFDNDAQLDARVLQNIRHRAFTRHFLLMLTGYQLPSRRARRDDILIRV